MSSRGNELVFTTHGASTPVRVVMVQPLLSVGSDASMDVRIAGVAAAWLVLRKQGEQIEVREVASGRAHVLAHGARIEIGGHVIARGEPRPERERGYQLVSAALSEALVHAERIDDALEHLAKEIAQSTRADESAIVLVQDGHTHLAASFRGAADVSAAELLSDTIVQEVLQSGRALLVDESLAQNRYAKNPSVARMRLRALACVPLKLRDHVLGVLFLGRRSLRDPFSDDELLALTSLSAMIVPLLVQLRRASKAKGAAESELLGASVEMERVRSMIARVAPTSMNILVHGETGSGKELVARAIHRASTRADGPFIAINCAAVPESLLMAELFGAKKGAFTGALADRVGYLEQANGGTLFLDELGEMPLAMQAALLRALETRRFLRVGDVTERASDFRLVAATHKNLDEAVKSGAFREDLLFRVREISIALPPLRQRAQDILFLARLFIKQLASELGVVHARFDDDCEAALQQYAWPGNVRELRATVRRALVLCNDGVVRRADLQLPSTSALRAAHTGDLSRTLDDARDAFTRDYVMRVLEREGGSRERAAAALGISIRSLYRHLGDGQD